MQHFIGQTTEIGQTKGYRLTAFRGLTNKFLQFCPINDTTVFVIRNACQNWG